MRKNIVWPVTPAWRKLELGMGLCLRIAVVFCYTHTQAKSKPACETRVFFSYPNGVIFTFKYYSETHNTQVNCHVNLVDYHLKRRPIT